MTAIPLGPGPEFDRIRSIAAALGAGSGQLGDDCAFVEPGGSLLALSTDVSVEGVHFRRDWLSLEEIGWRAAAGALSDLAAAGAEPVGVLAAVTAPPALTEPELADLMRGVGEAAVSVGGMVIGGDLSQGESLALAVTVVGRAVRRLGRRGALPGDLLWVTGRLGGARAALAAWTTGNVPAPEARRRFAHPEPRVFQGRWLAALGAHAMMDLSDGLGGDAHHLSAASGVALRINLDLLPVDPSVAAAAGKETFPLFAARGGEDYELLVAMPPEFQGTPEFELTRIGDVGPGKGVVFELAGRSVAVTGYDHFA